MTTIPDARPVPRARRRRRRLFSLNGLAIQLAAFALSFTLVALLVVSGSKAAFVEPSEALEDYVPVGLAPTAEPDHPRPTPSVPSAPPSAPPSVPALVEEAPATVPPTPLPPAVEEPAPTRTAIMLTDTDAGTAMFGVETVLSPGVHVDRCIEVTHDGDGEGVPVLLYAAGTRGDLGPYLELTIEVGPGGSGWFGGCDGFTPSATVYSGTLADFASAHDSYATGRETWVPEQARDARIFRFGLALRDDADASGKSVGFGFTWESRAD